MLNLGYPGGPIVDTCARAADRAAGPFTPPKFRDGKAAWSFSGLKTAVKTAHPGRAKAWTPPGRDPRVRALCRTSRRPWPRGS